MAGKVQINKGKIRDNALKALVKSNLFRHKVERKKKGKGSYNRQVFKNKRDGFFDCPAFIWPFAVKRSGVFQAAFQPLAV